MSRFWERSLMPMTTRATGRFGRAVIARSAALACLIACGLAQAESSPAASATRPATLLQRLTTEAREQPCSIEFLGDHPSSAAARPMIDPDLALIARSVETALVPRSHVYVPELDISAMLPVPAPAMACFDATNPPSDEIIIAVNQAMRQFLDAGYNTGGRWSGAVGTSRALTWSFVPDGTSIPASPGITASAAPSNLFAQMDSKFAGVGGRATWIAQFQSVFDRWALLTGTSYTRVTSGGNDWDDGAALHGSAGNASRGDIRISGRALDGSSGVLAYNFFPSTGDMVLDTAESWASGNPGFVFLRNTISHEHGHGLALEHTCSTNATILMEPFLSTSFDGPRHDDIRGVSRLYGDAYENNETSGAATNLGALSAGSTINPSTVPAPSVTQGSLTAISVDGDDDYYSFTTAAALNVSITLTPIGSTYDSSPQNGDGSCQTGNSINSLNQADLAFRILASNGTTVLTTVDATAAGSAESVANFALGSSGTFFVHVYEDGAPTESQMYTLSITGSGGCSNPTINTPPAGQTLCAGSPLSLSVAATGGTLSYQWRRNAANIAGATASTYNDASITTLESGTYDVVVTNSCGSTTSTGASVVVNTPASFTTNPSSLIRCEGAAASFAAAATGTAPISYQWRLNGNNIPGATGQTLNINVVDAADAGSYTAIATNSCGSVTSTAATLTVQLPASVVTSPSSQTVCEDAPVTFTASFSGTPTPTIQWRKNGVAIPGATGGSYTIPSVSASDAGSYDAIGSNSCASTPSNAATLTVNADPSISDQPDAVSVCDGEPFNFSVSSPNAVSYQWRLGGSNIPGATGPSYSGTASAPLAGTYDVVVTNGCGATTSSGALLTVNAGPQVTTQPSDATVASGSPASFAVVATGSGTLTYQWRKDGSNLSEVAPYSGTTAATLQISAVTAAEAGAYDVVVTSPCGSTTSNPATLALGGGCPADVNDGANSGNPDGGVDINDLLYFLAAFEAGSSDADLDNDGVDPQQPDGGVDVSDLLFFLSHFEAGC